MKTTKKLTRAEIEKIIQRDLPGWKLVPVDTQLRKGKNEKVEVVKDGKVIGRQG